MLAEYLRVHPHRFLLLPHDTAGVKIHILLAFSLSLNILSISFLCSVTLTCSQWYLPSPSSLVSQTFQWHVHTTTTLSTRPYFSSDSLPLICFRCRSIICSLLGKHDGTLAWSALASSLTCSCKQWAERSQLTAAALPLVVSGLNVSKIQNRQTWAQGYIHTMCFIQLFLSKLKRWNYLILKYYIKYWNKVQL